ncbi:hypothetical protein [Streptomyces sp. NPDC058486]|uniref:hypothetical protein n=1 Tax=unclassified Streptomyces TaxID=2593676 RepID=UPI00364DD8A8
MTHQGEAGNAGFVDEEAVMRARVLLLGSGRLSDRQELEAYRVLAPVSPAAYAPKLVRRLRWERATTPERREELAVEAVAAARLLGPGHPLRTEILCEALGSYGSELSRQGRRAEALAVFEESAAVGRAGYERGQVGHPGYGAGHLATALSEEGRHAEAVASAGPVVDGEHPDFWSAVARSARLEAAGRVGEAVETFGAFLEAERVEAAEGRGSYAILVWALRRQADVLDGAGRHGEADAVRREALDVLARLAEDGEPKSWSDIHSWWATLFALSVRPDEPPASAAAPAPAFGENTLHWSPDVLDTYIAAVPALEEEKAALRGKAEAEARAEAEADPARWLPALSAAHRRLTARAVLRHRSHRILDELRPLFDEGVALARRPGSAPGAEARALTDRALFLLAAREYGEAHADLAAAEAARQHLAAEAERQHPAIVTRT